MRRRKKHLIPLSELLKGECLGDLAKYADIIYIDISKTGTKETDIVKKCPFWSNFGHEKSN